MLDWLGDNLLAPVLAAIFTAALIRVGSVRGAVAQNTRLVNYLNDDLRRWVRDRDRQLEIELKTITNQAGPQLYSGGHVRHRAAAKRRALHEYRDEATGKLRELAELEDGEGILHRYWRRREGRPPLALHLPADCRDALARWREPATNPADATAPPVSVDDPSRADLEPALGELEAE